MTKVYFRKMGAGGSGGGSGSCHADGIYQTPTGHVVATTCQEWVDLHFQSISPTVSIRGTPAFGLYETGHDIVNPQIEGRGVLGGNPTGTLTLMEFFRGAVGGTSIGTVANPAAGSWVDPTDAFTVSSNQQYSARLTDDQGRTATASGNYIFVYPWYATTNTITTLTKQPLQNGGSYRQATMVPETAVDKFKEDMREVLTGVEVYNTISSQWEWMGGSKANSLSLWTQSSVNHTVQGNVVSYNRYTHNGVQTGSAQLRFWVV